MLHRAPHTLAAWPKLTCHHQTLTLSSLTSPTNSTKGSHPGTQAAAAAPTHRSAPRLRTTTVAPHHPPRDASTKQPSRLVYSGASERSCGGTVGAGGSAAGIPAGGSVVGVPAGGSAAGGWRRLGRRGDVRRLVYRRASEKLCPAAAVGRRSRNRGRMLRWLVFEDLWLGQWGDLRRPVYRRASRRSSASSGYLWKICDGYCVDFGVVRFLQEIEPKKPEPNTSVFCFSGNRSVVVCLKTEIFIHRKTEPNCRLKPNAHPYAQTIPTNSMSCFKLPRGHCRHIGAVCGACTELSQVGRMQDAYVCLPA
jgi:hypothetical protein